VNTFLSLFKKEMSSCFLSPVAYVVMFFFWVLTGGNFIWILRQLANGESLTEATQLMFGGLLTFILPVFIPLITMRLFSEERKLGTLEALLTTPINVKDLVLAKFAGGLVFYMVLWIPVLVYTYIETTLSPDASLGFPDFGGLRAGAFGTLLVGSLFISIGLFLSSLTSNQIISAIAGVAVLFGSMIGLTLMAYSASSPVMRLIGQFFSPFTHMMDFSRGAVDSRYVVLYLSLTVWFLFATAKVVENKRT
jgi:ABC-2 type transport system permease protein